LDKFFLLYFKKAELSIVFLSKYVCNKEAGFIQNEISRRFETKE